MSVQQSPAPAYDFSVVRRAAANRLSRLAQRCLDGRQDVFVIATPIDYELHVGNLVTHYSTAALAESELQVLFAHRSALRSAPRC